MEKTLYALLTCKTGGSWPIVVQVSFNKEELEEIAEAINSFGRYEHATVEEVTKSTLEWNWPDKK